MATAGGARVMSGSGPVGGARAGEVRCPAPGCGQLLYRVRVAGAGETEIKCQRCRRVVIVAGDRPRLATVA